MSRGDVNGKNHQGDSASQEMGVKGIMKKAAESFEDFIADPLSGLEGVIFKRMFGGKGLYQDGIFLGILSGGKIYFKTDEKSRKTYLKAGSKPFTYQKTDAKTGQKKTVSLKRYYEIPVDILEDRSTLKRWAREAANDH